MTVKNNMLLSVAFILLFVCKGYSQKEIDLADEYFQINDFKKAEQLYSNYIFQEDKLSRVYDNYRQCLIMWLHITGKINVDYSLVTQKFLY